MRLGSVPFLKAVEDVTGGNNKIQRKDFQQAGILPVIDQGQEEIAGYTDDMEAAFQGSLPVVLFGDHTRIFKYADKPFALGADSVKVLAPRDGFDAKFIYYYLSSCDIPSRGYSRHFKFLKEQVIPAFAPSEQHRIIEILNEADRLRRLCREADAKAARILPALFLKMFGDPATNPRGWPTANLESVSEIISGAAKGRQFKYAATVELPYMRVANVKDGYLDLSSIKTITVRIDEIDKFSLRSGDLLMTEGGDPDKLGRAAIWSGEVETCLHQNHIFKVRVKREIVLPEYLRELIGSPYGKAYFLGVAKKTTGIATINRTQLGRFPVLIPPINLQTDFVAKFLQLRLIESHQINAAKAIESIFSELLQRAFSGQLTAKWREAHIKELLAEMEQQARLLNLPLPKEREAAS